jgi:SSS family solute:Na+ symporter
MASALSVTALWPLLSTGIDPAYPGFLTSLVVLVLVSKLTRHSPSEDVAAYYWDGAESHAASALPDAAKPDIALASKTV